jgi:hypothetical protein
MLKRVAKELQGNLTDVIQLNTHLSKGKCLNFSNIANKMLYYRTLML